MVSLSSELAAMSTLLSDVGIRRDHLLKALSSGVRQFFGASCHTHASLAGSRPCMALVLSLVFPRADN